MNTIPVIHEKTFFSCVPGNNPAMALYGFRLPVLLFFHFKERMTPMEKEQAQVAIEQAVIEKMLLAQTPGLAMELTPEEAELAGAFYNDSLADEAEPSELSDDL